MKSSADRIANSYQSPNATGVVVDASRTLEGNSRMYKRPLAALTATALSTALSRLLPPSGKTRWMQRPSARSNRSSAGWWKYWTI